jgi:hypothetical protein
MVVWGRFKPSHLSPSYNRRGVSHSILFLLLIFRLIDYGQTKRLTQDERLAYARIVAAIGNDEHDSHTIASMMRNAGFKAQDDTDNHALTDYALLFFDSDIEGKRRGYPYPSLYFQSLMSKNPLIDIPDSAGTYCSCHCCWRNSERHAEGKAALYNILNRLSTCVRTKVFIARSSLLFRGLGSALGTAPVRTAHMWQKHAEKAIEMSLVHDNIPKVKSGHRTSK